MSKGFPEFWPSRDCCEREQGFHCLLVLHLSELRFQTALLVQISFVCYVLGCRNAMLVTAVAQSVRNTVQSAKCLLYDL